MELQFNIQPGLSAKQIEDACKQLQLELTMRTELKTLPQNTHWHFKMGREKGVLEITLLPLTNQLILSCKKNRQADWITTITAQLRSKLEK